MNSIGGADVTSILGVSVFRPKLELQYQHFGRHLDNQVGGTQILFSFSSTDATVTFYQGNICVGSYTHPAGKVSMSVQSGINGNSAQPWDNPTSVQHESACEDRKRVCVRIRFQGYFPLNMVTDEFAKTLLMIIFNY